MNTFVDCDVFSEANTDDGEQGDDERSSFVLTLLCPVVDTDEGCLSLFRLYVVKSKPELHLI